MRNILLIAVTTVAAMFIIGLIGLLTQGMPQPDRTKCFEAMRNQGYSPKSYDEHMALKARIDQACR